IGVLPERKTAAADLPRASCAEKPPHVVATHFRRLALDDEPQRVPQALAEQRAGEPLGFRFQREPPGKVAVTCESTRRARDAYRDIRARSRSSRRGTS